MTSGHSRIQRRIDKGCPQGSVLGPLLWNLVLDGLLRIDLPEEVTILAFADDTVLLVQGDSRRVMERRLQEAITQLEAWAVEARLQFSARKTQAMFLKGNLSQARPPVIRINNIPVRFHEQVVFLGVTLDRRLSFLPHVRQVCSKAESLFQKVVRLVRLKYGVRQDVYTTLYRTVFRPIVQYAQRV